MTIDNFATTVLMPGLSLLDRVAGIRSGNDAAVLLLAIACQESGLTARRQVGGPARGWFQMEKAGGVRGVLNHPLSSGPASKICAELCIPTDAATVFEAVAWSDYLSVAFGRLLLWTDPANFPTVGQHDAAWNYYLRCWRPGIPRIGTWASIYSAAGSAITNVQTPRV